MQNTIITFKQSFFISKKLVYLSEKWKTLACLNCFKVQYLLLKFCTRFRLTNVYKNLFGIFLIFFLDLQLLINMVSVSVETRSFFIFANNSSSKQNKKNPTHRFVDIGK